MPCYLFSFKKNNIELHKSEKKEVELSSQVKKKELLWRAIISFYYERERAAAAVEGI